MNSPSPGQDRDASERLDVRDVTRSDVDALVELVQSAYRGDRSRRGWTTEADLIDGQRIDRAMLAATVADPASLIRVAVDTGRPVGCYELRSHPDDASGVVSFGMFAVDPDRQSLGIGRRLLADAESVAAERLGAARIRMLVICQRRELIAWYGRRGFRPTGEEEPFPYGDARFGVPRRADLSFVVLAKDLHAPGG